MPDGKAVQMPMKDRGDGTAIGSMAVKLPGLYRITDGALSTMVAIGSLNPQEISDVRTTDKMAKALIEANTGSVVWLGESGAPDIRRVDRERRTSGTSGVSGQWIGLIRNGDYMVTGIRDTPMLVGLLALLLALLPILTGWRREGK